MADSPDPEIQFHAPPPEFGQGDDQNEHDDHEYEEERRYSRAFENGDTIIQVIERYEAILGEPPVTEKKKTAVRQISTDDDQDYSFDQLNTRVAKLEQTSYNTPTATPRPWKTCGKFDNGFYAVGEVNGLHVEFLVDTGSTTTLLACKMFDQILERNKPNLEPSRLNIKDVNGNTIIAYGQSIMNLNFNGKQFPQTIIVCDISPDAIIGQDFLLHYVNKIDYQRMVLQTSLTDIQCWVAGENRDDVPGRKSKKKPPYLPIQECLYQWISLSVKN
ncbi:unnamed protein product [Mytilus edulis]|uniref:Peptidase A2 domain-containing protein n=1 Tax=Mytilus edulis TaxID=6550 RepID=A0A8S3THC4_MYTED|nr:unnamed protein product [Mytilus edulis]